MTRRRSRLGQVLSAGAAVLLLVILLGPFFQVVYGALFPQAAGFSLEPVYQVFLATPEYLLVFWRTLALCALIVAGQTVLSVLAGLGFAKDHFPGKGLCFFLLLVVMVLPLQVTLVPNFRILGTLGLLDTQWALVLPALFAPLGTFLMTQSFRAVPDEILEACAQLSERYITDRFLPDKAIDLLDESAACASIKSTILTDYEKLNKQLKELYDRQQELEQETENPNYEALAKAKADIIVVKEKLKELEPQIKDVRVTLDDVAKVVELWTGIPAEKVSESEFARLAKLEEHLKARIIGQDEAIHAVTAAIRRSKVHLNSKRRPASFIFVGPTGVGKTELVKVLADELFDDKTDPLIRVDMSEYMEKHTVSRLIGSPPGYVGFDEAGQLTEKIRRKPYAVVLFDEIEKAHPDVLNILLQILDDGEITDAHGRKVNFENTIIVMTSNAGSATKEGTVGFGRSVNEQDADRAMKALQQFLRPEFINRVDAVITFNRLSEENFHGIARIMLNELVGSLKEKGITFTYDDALVELLTKKSYSLTYGARNLRRTIQRELEDPMATQIIDSYEHPISQVKATVENDAIKLYTL